MITSNPISVRVSPGNSGVSVDEPLTRLAHMIRLEKGREGIMDIDCPAFVRKRLRLGLPAVVAPGRLQKVPAPISRLLNIVLGQDGILFPVEEN